eukprot:6188538-Pleurochrysis_carterae.AAC.3
MDTGRYGYDKTASAQDTCDTQAGHPIVPLYISDCYLRSVATPCVITAACPDRIRGLDERSSGNGDGQHPRDCAARRRALCGAAAQPLREGRNSSNGSVNERSLREQTKRCSSFMVEQGGRQDAFELNSSVQHVATVLRREGQSRSRQELQLLIEFVRRVHFNHICITEVHLEAIATALKYLELQPFTKLYIEGNAADDMFIVVIGEIGLFSSRAMVANSTSTTQTSKITSCNTNAAVPPHEVARKRNHSKSAPKVDLSGEASLLNAHGQLIQTIKVGAYPRSRLMVLR